MKNKNKSTEKNFDTVKTFREIKERISLEMSTMTFAEIKEYLKNSSKKLYSNKGEV